ncbi:MAG TPA: glycoside hydrolase family 6 protein [Candidatus Saccharimonadales bacterium]|nr:glycoside hydrolase family 6 protein [Candidatus Saccharimonadales bacterium]
MIPVVNDDKRSKSESTKPAEGQVLSDTVDIGGPPSWTALPFYVNPDNEATAYAKANPTASGASLIAKEGSVATAQWFGDWTPNVQSATNDYVSKATQKGAVPVLVFYAIPQRDCGGYSAGGFASTTEYINWVRSATAGIGNRTAVVILEPDALAGLDCLSAANQRSRYAALAQAVSILKSDSDSTVYVDAGNPAWQTAATMATRLKTAGIAQADGFSLNVSNYMSIAANQAYGDELSQLVGNKHYIIDTSRNGNGSISPSDWCNAPAAALGRLPTVHTGDARNDAFMWIKLPWESDGTCNGGPDAGMVYWSFAVKLAKNAGW